MRISAKSASPAIETTPLSGSEATLVEDISLKPQSRYAAFYSLVANVLLPFVVIRLLLVVIGVVTIYYILPLINRKQPIFPLAGSRMFHFPAMLVLMWNRFDSGFYLNIAHDGYWGANTLHSASNWGFFPLYPLLIHLVASPFGSSMNTYSIVGIILANIAALVAVVYLYKLTTKEFNSSIAARAVFYLGLFPMSFYLSAIYPESLFLALSISSLYYARSHRWWLAGVLGGLATLTRATGVLLTLVIAWEYWQFLADRYAPQEQAGAVVTRVQCWLRSHLLGLWRSLASWRTWTGFGALALVPCGLLVFALYSKWKVGTFFAYSMAQDYGWNHYFSNPILLVLHMLHHPSAPSPYDWNFYALNIISTLIFFCLIIPIFRKLPAVYGILTVAFIAMPLATGKMDSVTRYYLTIFPLYMLLAWWTSQGTPEQQMRRHSLLVASFALLLALGMVLFTLGVYSIA